MNTQTKQQKIDKLLEIYERRFFSGDPNTRNRMHALIESKLRALVNDEEWEEIQWELMEIATSCETRINRGC